MGAGKSSSAIWHINHSDGKFVYCTPYLSEVDRILKECSAKDFKQPVSGKSGIGGKRYSLMNLMSNGCNVATTHALFGQLDDRYDGDDDESDEDNDIDFGDSGFIALAKDGEYTLIIDEAYDVIQTTGLSPTDIQYMKNCGLIEINYGRLCLTEEGMRYDGNSLKDDLKKIREHTIVVVGEENGKEKFSSLIYPPEIFGAFKDVYILTYLFEKSIMHSYFDMNGLEYQRIGVRPVDDHYEFFDGETLLPDYVLDIKDKIDICDKPKLNAVGSSEKSLSKNWHKNHPEGVEELKRNHRTFMRHCKTKNGDYMKNMWTTFLKYQDRMEQSGSRHGFVSVGTRATNEFADKSHLAFLVNVFMNPNLRITLSKMDVDVSEDVYALSSLVQWVWRSAIRNGEPIKIYIPSKRMRNLFIGWLDDITAQAAAQRVELAEV